MSLTSYRIKELFWAVLPTLSTFNDPLVAQLTEQLVENSVAFLERYKYSLEGSNPAVIELEKEVEYTSSRLYTTLLKTHFFF